MGTQERRKRQLVLRHDLDEDALNHIIEAKKTDPFKSGFRGPRRDEVHVHSVRSIYEAVLRVSARYKADYFRRAVHPIRVDYNVTEVVLGEGNFPIIPKSRIARALLGKCTKNKVELELEEHVFVDREATIHIDHHNKETKFRHDTGARSLESYPARVLRAHKDELRIPRATKDDALLMLGKELMRPSKKDVRDLSEETVITEISEIYVPIFEARLVGPGKKVAILRIDAVRKRMI